MGTALSPLSRPGDWADAWRVTERRRATRSTITGAVRVLWEDASGQDCVCTAKVANISASGLKIMVDTKIPERTYVSVNDRALGITGRASVRYCRFEKGKYAVGLEFSGTGWRTRQGSPGTS